ncbi:hypothetical protein EX30DRAFT_143807 [Ascodesmis nigricans]|uniref:Uncharacterized protein n=1 Tax=Ascodesmis nigricans TaxID=341454 RepID=A0A4S2N1G2_9PEZI|nr:hypothetical protein EX30DRAFT_143807 [Ascodesmis nigricans]
MRAIQRQRECEKEQWEERLQKMAEVNQATNDVDYKGLETQQFEEQEKKARTSAMELDKLSLLTSEHMPLQNQSHLTINKGESSPKRLSQSSSLGDVLKLENLPSQSSDTESYHSPFIPAQSEFPTEKPAARPATSSTTFTSLKRPSQSSTSSRYPNISKKTKTFPPPAPSIAREDTNDIFTPLGKKTEPKGSAEKLNIEGNVRRGDVRRTIGGACGTNPNVSVTEDEPRRDSLPIIASKDINDSKTPSKTSATSRPLRFVSADSRNTLQSRSSQNIDTTVEPPPKPTATKSSTNSILSDTRTGTVHTEHPGNKNTSPPPPSAASTQSFTQSFHTCIIDLTSSPSQPTTQIPPSRSLSAIPIPLLHHTSDLITEMRLESDDLDAELVLEAAKAALGVDGRSWWDVG